MRGTQNQGVASMHGSSGIDPGWVGGTGGGVGAGASGTVEASPEAGRARCGRRHVAVTSVSRRDSRVFRLCELRGIYRKVVRPPPAGDRREAPSRGSAGSIAGARGGSALGKAELVSGEGAHSSRGTRHRARMDPFGVPEDVARGGAHGFGTRAGRQARGSAPASVRPAHFTLRSRCGNAGDVSRGDEDNPEEQRPAAGR